jgi:hypothetical protein
MKTLVGLVVGLVLCASSNTNAQLPDNEVAPCKARIETVLLKQKLTAKVAFPASSGGIDLTMGGMWDLWKASLLEHRFGVGVRRGEQAEVTKVKTGTDLLEIYLNGGGWGNAVSVYGDPRGQQDPRGGGSGTAEDPFESLRESRVPGAKAPGGSRINVRLNRPVSCDELADPAKMREILAPLVDWPSTRF